MQMMRFRNGDEIPALGLGTWQAEPGVVGAAVRAAIEAGYRHLDCAAIYQNQTEIGEALREVLASGEVRREDLFVTSKLWNDRHAPADVIPALDESLADLGLEYLDLYLVHWPVAHKKGVWIPETTDEFVSLDEIPLAATWSKMEDAVDRGLCRHIGVSNFSEKKIRALAAGARIAPEANQVELHPYLQQQALVDYCLAEGMVVTAYSPLGSPARPPGLRAEDEPVLLEDPVIGAIAARHDATPAQVLIRWAMQRGTTVIPKSVHVERMQQNLAAADLTLTPDDMCEIAGIERARRYISGATWAPDGSPYTIESLWDE